jgi:prepilin-type N-terminal cleavage/methylation domain-containing protein
MNNKMQKGFTLVELLIVIAILAVLSVTVVVVLNPAELLKQARDSTRISDLASVNSAIALYLTDVGTPYLGGPSTACSSATSRCTVATTSPFTATGNGCTSGTANATTTVDGNGWVAVTLSSITGGSPLARLPIDPINSGNQFYGYACGTGSALSYELNTNMESSKYSNGGSSDVEANTKDGGTNNLIYEVGNNLSQ